ncbi:uncharacterized protein [Primulina eburnea]|uniref:uncharacterized protein n=1 Tax=Primulina eburnea TaxID=1245227 RepID=UPI003C6C2667
MDISFASATLRPPVLDGTNYSLWKVKVRYYIKSLDERVWQRVINGWTPPLATDQEGDNRPKPENDWTADEVQNSNHNSKALNAIFTTVDMNMFSLITNCTSAKSACDILQCHCEGSESVRRTRLRLLTSKFEMMRMEESESILEYDRRLREIANEAFSAGEAISNEAKDTSKMSVEDLISSLCTFEMNLDMQRKDKGNTIALQASNDSYNELLQISQEVNDSDLCEDSISFITKKFGDYLKRIREKKKDAQPSKSSNLPEKPQRLPAKLPTQTRNEGKGQLKSRKFDSVQCREYQGFGHYANECANRLRKNKGYNVSLSDEESDHEEKSTDEDNQTSLTALLTETRWLQVNPSGVALGVATPGYNICEKSVCFNSTVSENLSEDDLEVDGEELTLESVQELYEELFEDWTKRNKLNANLVKENAELKSVVKENADLKAVVAKLEVILSKKDLELGKTREDIQKATDTLSKFNTSSSKLESILLMGRDDKRGLGFKDRKADTSPQLQSKSPIKSSPPIKQPSAPISKKRKRRDDRMNQKWSQMLPRMLSNTRRNTSHHRPTVRQIWVPKIKTHCKVVYTSLKTNTAGHWYFDSGSSRHMTGSKEHLIDVANTWDNTVSGITAHGSYGSYGSSEPRRKGISHEFSAPKTPQQNGIAERKNRTLQEMARVMLTSKNSVFGQKPLTQHVIFQIGDQLAKFDSKSDKCLFLGYATNSRAYHLKKKTAEDEVEDLLETQAPLEKTDFVPDVATSDTTCDTDVTKSQEDAHSDNEVVDDGPCIPSKIQKNHPSSQIIGGMSEDVKTRKKDKIDYRKMVGLVCMSTMYSQVRFSCFVSQIELKNVMEALKDEFWINAMHDELEEFVRNDVWTLVPPPDHGNVTGSRWVFKNKTDESGNIIRNKARLVAQGYTQVEGVDFDETFAHVARIESIRLLLAIACYMKIKLFQMYVKSAFLNGFLSEEVHVRQPKGFEDPHNPNHVYKLKKALYGLKQAPRA